MSPAHLQRTFRALVGVSPRQYLEACRLEILKERLRSAPTVTDAIYVRPWIQARMLALSSSSLKARVSGTYSRALYASSTPGNSTELGIELNASIRWESRDGFDILTE